MLTLIEIYNIHSKAEQQHRDDALRLMDEAENDPDKKGYLMEWAGYHQTEAEDHYYQKREAGNEFLTQKQDGYIQ